MIRKLKTIMVLSFVLVNALFLAGVSYASYQYFFNFTSEEISETKLSLLNESANKLSGVINNISEAGTFIAIDRSVTDIFSDNLENPYEALTERTELKNIVNNISSLKDEVYSIEIYTDRYANTPYLYDHTILPEDRLKEYAWFEPFIDSVDNGWVPNHESNTIGQNVISYVHRIINQRNNTVGYLKVNVLASDFMDYLRDTDLYAEINEPFILLNTGNRIIAETHSTEDFPVLNEIISNTDNSIFKQLTKEYEDLRNHHQIIRSNNEYYLLLISRPNYDQWRLVQVVPVDDLYEETKQMGAIVLLIGLVAIVLSIPIVYALGRWITKPIGQMIQAMRKVEKGQFDTKMKKHYVEEYDIMSSNFNRMTSELSDLVSKVELENENRREAEMRALQSQIMPHFLYNTLDMIKWKSLDHDADDVGEMVNNLSKMLRIGLSGGLSFIRLRDELEHAKCYINIQKQRLQQDIKYKARVPASIKDLYVPKIILQPFIENSMKYGYDHNEKQQVRIDVEANLIPSKEQEVLKITIRDYGKGLPENFNDQHVRGIGIKNVRDRIRMYCGDGYNIEINNHEDGISRNDLTDSTPRTNG